MVDEFRYRNVCAERIASQHHSGRQKSLPVGSPIHGNHETEYARDGLAIEPQSNLFFNLTMVRGTVVLTGFLVVVVDEVQLARAVAHAFDERSSLACAEAFALASVWVAAIFFARLPLALEMALDVLVPSAEAEVFAVPIPWPKADALARQL